MVDLQIEATAAMLHGGSRATVTVTDVEYVWGSIATAGLWRVESQVAGGAGESMISFVKLLRHPRYWPGLALVPEAFHGDIIETFPWRFELDMQRSGIAAVMPDGFRTAALRHVSEIDADHLVLWSEWIEQRADPWTLEDFRRAAVGLGRLAARRREGSPTNDALPEVCRLPRGDALRYFTEKRVVRGAVPQLHDADLWVHPLMVAYAEATGDCELRHDLLALAERLPALLDGLDQLPQTYAHGDASPQNILRPVDEPESLVIIDWGFGGLLAVGFDLGQLLVGLMHAGQLAPELIEVIDPVITEGYLAGLAIEGYEVDPVDVRAGYLFSLACRSVLTALPYETLGEDQPTAEQCHEFTARLHLTRALVDLCATH